MISLSLVSMLSGCSPVDRPSVLRSPLVEEPPEASDPIEPAPQEPDPTTPTEPPGTEGMACYLGPTREHDACADVARLLTPHEEYDYPPPLSGSAQYLVPARYLVLADVDPTLEVAPNFVLEELAQEFKGPYGVVQAHAVAHLQDVRDEVGALVINSGYRNPVYNAGVGGASSSRHMYGDAFDIDPVSATLGELADACEANGAGFVGVYATHIHCDWRDDPLDPSFYDSARSRVYETVQPTLEAFITTEGGVFVAPASGWDEGEPLREWVAFDDEGTVLEEATSATFDPPSGTARVEVLVGRALRVSLPVQ